MRIRRSRIFIVQNEPILETGVGLRRAEHTLLTKRGLEIACLLNRLREVFMAVAIDDAVAFVDSAILLHLTLRKSHNAERVASALPFGDFEADVGCSEIGQV